MRVTSHIVVSGSPAAFAPPSLSLREKDGGKGRKAPSIARFPDNRSTSLPSSRQEDSSHRHHRSLPAIALRWSFRVRFCLRPATLVPPCVDITARLAATAAPVSPRLAQVKVPWSGEVPDRSIDPPLFPARHLRR